MSLGGKAAKLRPLYEHQYTRLHMLESSEDIAAEINRGDFVRILTSYSGNRPLEIGACLFCRSVVREIHSLGIDAPGPSHLEPFMLRIGNTPFHAVTEVLIMFVRGIVCGGWLYWHCA